MEVAPRSRWTVKSTDFIARAFLKLFPNYFQEKKHSFLSRQNCSGVTGPFDESEFVEVLKTFPLLPLWIQQQVSLLLGCC